MSDQDVRLPRVLRTAVRARAWRLRLRPGRKIRKHFDLRPRPVGANAGFASKGHHIGHVRRAGSASALTRQALASQGVSIMSLWERSLRHSIPLARQVAARGRTKAARWIVSQEF
jgi:hypothetical protein